jgi:thermitase
MLPAATGLTSAQSSEQYVPNELVVAFQPGFMPSGGHRWDPSFRKSVAVDGSLGVITYRLASGVDPVGLAHRLRVLPWVRYVEPNFRVRHMQAANDPWLSRQYGLDSTRSIAAWARYVPRGIAPLAIVDTGVDLTHPDLSEMLYRRNGAVVQVDLVHQDGDATDDNGHGTHCAGIAAAQTGNGIGVAGVGGVVPGPEVGVRIMPVKVLNANGEGTTAGVAQGIRWSVENGARVISLSLGSDSGARVMEDAVNFAVARGVVVVAAAGNEGAMSRSYPASYEAAISVAATDATDRLSAFSNYGPWVDLAAPGSSVYSTLMGGDYGWMSGTSMATPYVAGAAALLAAQAPNLTAGEIRAAMLGSAISMSFSDGRAIAGGRLDVAAALELVRTETDPLITGFSASTATLEHAGTVRFRVDLSRPVPAGGLRLPLSITPKVAAFPRFVRFLEGQTGKEFSFDFRTTPRPVTYRLVLQAPHDSAECTLRHLPLGVESLSLPTEVRSGGRITATVRLNMPAPNGRTRVRLSANGPIRVRGSIDFAPGTREQTVEVTAQRVRTARPATVTASLANSREQVLLTVLPN